MEPIELKFKDISEFPVNLNKDEYTKIYVAIKNNNGSVLISIASLSYESYDVDNPIIFVNFEYPDTSQYFYLIKDGEQKGYFKSSTTEDIIIQWADNLQREVFEMAEYQVEITEPFAMQVCRKGIRQELDSLFENGYKIAWNEMSFFKIFEIIQSKIYESYCKGDIIDDIEAVDRLCKNLRIKDVDSEFVEANGCLTVMVGNLSLAEAVEKLKWRLTNDEIYRVEQSRKICEDYKLARLDKKAGE